MKAVVDGIELEGTPEEVVQAIAALRSINVEPDGSTAGIAASEPPTSEANVSIAMARRILQRKPLSESQIGLLSCLASNYPSGTTYEEIQKSAGLSSGQLAGVLGGFKLRVNTTPGYIKGMSFLWWDWDEESGGYKYYLAPGAFDAIKEAKL